MITNEDADRLMTLVVECRHTTREACRLQTDDAWRRDDDAFNAVLAVMFDLTHKPAPEAELSPSVPPAAVRCTGGECSAAGAAVVGAELEHGEPENGDGVATWAAVAAHAGDAP